VVYFAGWRSSYDQNCADGPGGRELLQRAGVDVGILEPTRPAARRAYELATKES